MISQTTLVRLKIKYYHFFPLKIKTQNPHIKIRGKIESRMRRNCEERRKNGRSKKIKLAMYRKGIRKGKR